MSQRAGDRSAHHDGRTQARDKRRPQDDADQEDGHPGDQEQADHPHVEVVHQRLRRHLLVAKQRGQIGDKGPDQRERHDPRGQERAHRSGSDRRPEDHAQRVHRKWRDPRHEDEADDRRQRVQPREQDERAPMQPEVRNRSQPESACIADQGRRLKCAARSGAASTITRRRRCHRTQCHRDERGCAEALEQASPAELCGAHAERDKEHRHHADNRAGHEKAPATEPIRIAREDRGKHHLGHGLGGSDEADIDGARLATGEIAEAELHGNADSHRANPEQTGCEKQRADRAWSGVAQLIIAGCLEHAGDLPVGHTV